jgi:hypothetical protein
VLWNLRFHRLVHSVNAQGTVFIIVLIVLCESIYNVSFRLLNIPIVSLRSDSNNDLQSLPSYLITLPNYNVSLWRINLHIQRLIYDLAWITSITILIYYMKCITVEWIGGAALGTYDSVFSLFIRFFLAKAIIQIDYWMKTFTNL